MRQFLDISRSLSLHTIIFLTIAVFCAVAWIAALFFLRPPARMAWRGWMTLCVSRAVPERTVLSVCAEAGIPRVVSLETSLRENPAPAVNFPSASGAEYQQTRANFFFDKTGSRLLYYIDDRAGRARLGQAVKRLAALGADCAVSIPDRGGYTAGIVCAAVFIVFAALSKNRAAMAAGGVFFAVFPFAAQTAASGAASCLALYSLFVLQKVWRRRGFLFAWLKKIPASAALASTVPAALASRSALLFLLTCAACVSSLYILFSMRALFGEKNSFAPRGIFPAYAAPVLSRRAAALLAFPPLAVFAFFALSLTSGALLPRAESLLLPGPVAFSGAPGFSLAAYEDSAVLRAHNRSLPSLAGLVTLSWKALTFPYRRLDAENARSPAGRDARAEAGALAPAGEIVAIPEFRQPESGGIVPFFSRYVFDESFISSIISRVSRGDSPVLEDVLAGQGRFAALDYVYGARRPDTASLALLAVSGILPLAGAAVFLIRKRFDDWGN